MDKILKKFLQISLLMIALFLTAIVFFVCFYRYSTLAAYNSILLFLTAFTALAALLVVSSTAAILCSYKTKKMNWLLLLLTNLGLKVLMPSIIYISGLLRVNKDALRQLYIELNNTLVLHTCKRGRYMPEDVLVILPHCLQNSKCGYKITGNISKCHRCGKCDIGEIARITEEMGVAVEIVTGGTAARNAVIVKRPKIVLSVACERDLTSGISDITGIPVLGIINERPYGPCCNTKVDLKILKSKLTMILGGNEELVRKPLFENN